MNIDEKDYYKIIDHLYLNQLDIDKSFFPKVIGNGQSNPTFLIQDKNAQFKVLRMQPSGDLVRGAHRVDREFLVLRALSERGFIVPEPIFLCDDSSVIGRQFYVMEFVDGDIFEG